MQDFLDKNKPSYTLRGLILSFLLGAVCAILLWFLFFWL
jgi:hypothetical protein